MVNNCYIKCQVCNSITRIRLQVGFLEQHPIVVSCGKCGTSLLGHVEIGQVSPSLKYDFENADIVNSDENENFIVECSGEFPVIKSFKTDSSERYIPSPFIRNHAEMGHDGYEGFCKSISTLNHAKTVWSSLKRVFDLFTRGEKSYLCQEIWKLLPKEQFPCRNDFEIMRAVHILEIQYLINPLRSDILQNLTFSSDILKLNIEELCKLQFFLSSHAGYTLPDMQSAVVRIYDEFIRVYPALIPAIATQYYQQGRRIVYTVEGSTTSTFDTVKQFSLDIYETLGNLLIIPVALNNIKYRDNYAQCREYQSRQLTLEEFISKLSKANRFHCMVDDEIYTNKLNVTINSKLRNAIGHNDISYDTFSQEITYIPNPKDRTKNEALFLLEFEDEAVRLFQAVLVISEYLYRLREVNLIREGNIPIIPEKTISFKEVGRNEPCPCGSGLKYKKCHGILI